MTVLIRNRLRGPSSFWPHPLTTKEDVKLFLRYYITSCFRYPSKVANELKAGLLTLGAVAKYK